VPNGFTLVEMLVAIAVALAFFGSMFVNRGSFDATVRLDGITREVALLARQAQTYGAGGRSELAVGEPHGIHLKDNNENRVILYSDDDNNSPNGYDASQEEVDRITLPPRYTISEFCTAGSSATDCNGGGAEKPNKLDIYFVRPSLEANYQSSGSMSDPDKAIVEITHGPSGNVGRVIIDKTGYISTP